MQHSLNGPEFSPQSGKAAKQLVILLHGLGADGNDLIGLAPEFADVLPDAHFIAPNAPFPCDMAPFGYQWFSLQDRSLENVLSGISKAAPILNQFIYDQLRRHGLGDENLALIGFSQGTMMSLHVGPRRPKPCAGILGYSGLLAAPELLEKELESRTPVCLIHGDADPIVPYSSLVEAVTTLRKLGFSVEDHTRPGLPHGIDGEGIEIGTRFLQRIFPV